MALAQLADLGFVPDGDLSGFLRRRIEQERLPVNTSGGQLSAGQAGAAGGMHGLVEAVTQLLGEAGERQVENARLAVVSGYGMVLYRYGACANAVVLERRVSLRVPVCSACGRAVFPRRLLCPDCGGSEWRDEPVDAGVLEAATRRDVRVGAVRTPLGPLAIARLEVDAAPGTAVLLDEEGDVPVVRGPTGREPGSDEA